MAAFFASDAYRTGTQAVHATELAVQPRLLAESELRRKPLEQAALPPADLSVATSDQASGTAKPMASDPAWTSAMREVCPHSMQPPQEAPSAACRWKDCMPLLPAACHTACGGDQNAYLSRWPVNILSSCVMNVTTLLYALQVGQNGGQADTAILDSFFSSAAYQQIPR